MKFSFYCADDEYCDFLRKSDPCVPYTMDKKRNQTKRSISFIARNIISSRQDKNTMRNLL